MPAEIEQAIGVLTLASFIIVIMMRDKIVKALSGKSDATSAHSGISRYLLPVGLVITIIGAGICYDASTMKVTVYAQGVGEIVNASLLAHQSMNFQQGGLFMILGTTLACTAYAINKRRR